jgi:hypothetical protein
VDQRGHRLVLIEDERGTSVGRRRRQRDRPTVDVHPAAASVTPERQRHRGVAQRRCDQIATPRPVDRAAEPVGEGQEGIGRMDSPANETDEEADAHRGQAELGHRGGGAEDYVVDPRAAQTQPDGDRKRPEDGEEENGNQRPPHQSGRPAYPVAQACDDRDNERRREELAQRDDHGVHPGRLRAEQHERVLGTVVDAGRVRGWRRIVFGDKGGREEQRRDQRDHGAREPAVDRRGKAAPERRGLGTRARPPRPRPRYARCCRRRRSLNSRARRGTRLRRRARATGQSGRESLSSRRTGRPRSASRRSAPDARRVPPHAACRPRGRPQLRRPRAGVPLRPGRRRRAC